LVSIVRSFIIVYIALSKSANDPPAPALSTWSPPTMPKASLSVNSLRMMARIHRIKETLTMPKLIYEHKEPLEAGTVLQVIDELVSTGFLAEAGEKLWRRTRKPMTDEMRKQLSLAVSTIRRQNSKDPEAPVNKVRRDVEPWEADLFGYPKVPIFLTGRVHRLRG
jgi:hypothetical protein